MVGVFDRIEQEKFDNLLSTYSSLLDELAPWRMQVIQAGEEASESSCSSIWIMTAYTIPHESAQVQSARMRKSRKDIMNAAKRRLDEGREKQQVWFDIAVCPKPY